MKKKETKEITIYANNMIYYIVAGIGWMGAGFFRMFDGLAFTICATICIVVTAYATVYSLFAKKEKTDEMAEVHEQKAKAKALDLLVVGFCILIILAVFWEEATMRIYVLAPFLMGVAQLTTGVLFARYEKAGD